MVKYNRLMLFSLFTLEYVLYIYNSLTNLNNNNLLNYKILNTNCKNTYEFVYNC
jgi:hypothetical protein